VLGHDLDELAPLGFDLLDGGPLFVFPCVRLLRILRAGVALDFDAATSGGQPRDLGAALPQPLSRGDEAAADR